MKEYKLVICHTDDDFNAFAAKGWRVVLNYMGAQYLLERDKAESSPAPRPKAAPKKK